MKYYWEAPVCGAAFFSQKQLWGILWNTNPMVAFRQTFSGSFFRTKHISPCLWIGITQLLLIVLFQWNRRFKVFVAMLPGTWPLKLCHLLTCLMCWILFQLDPVSKHISALKKHPSLCVVLCWLSIFFTWVRLQWKFSQIACLKNKLLLDYFCWGRPLCPQAWDSLKWVHHSFLESPAIALLVHEY